MNHVVLSPFALFFLFPFGCVEKRNQSEAIREMEVKRKSEIETGVQGPSNSKKAKSDL